ncbi:hypothetical protein ABLN76_20625, partial [Mycobacterium tuberculosis]|uniref:hypothetical protein n=1 Tax=Mycobacterium tuberculosis TaxID=1773 RepID=UPI0032B6129A
MCVILAGPGRATIRPGPARGGARQSDPAGRRFGPARPDEEPGNQTLPGDDSGRHGPMRSPAIRPCRALRALTIGPRAG